MTQEQHQSTVHPVRAKVESVKNAIDQFRASQSSATSSYLGVDLTQENKDKSEQIKSLESMLRQTPPGSFFEGTRQHLASQIDTLKRSIVNQKPAGVRLEGCKGALTRAMERTAEAQSIHSLASAVLQEAQTDEAKLRADCAAIEREIRMTIPSSPTQHNSLEHLQSGMEQVVQEMSAGGRVPPDTVALAQQQMLALFTSLQELSRSVLTPAAGPAPVALSPNVSMSTPLQRAPSSPGIPVVMAHQHQAIQMAQAQAAAMAVAAQSAEQQRQMAAAQRMAEQRAMVEAQRSFVQQHFCVHPAQPSADQMLGGSPPAGAMGGG